MPSIDDRVLAGAASRRGRPGSPGRRRSRSVISTVTLAGAVMRYVSVAVSAWPSPFGLIASGSAARALDRERRGVRRRRGGCRSRAVPSPALIVQRVGARGTSRRIPRPVDARCRCLSRARPRRRSGGRHGNRPRLLRDESRAHANRGAVRRSASGSKIFGPPSAPCRGRDRAQPRIERIPGALGEPVSRWPDTALSEHGNAGSRTSRFPPR